MRNKKNTQTQTQTQTVPAPSTTELPIAAQRPSADELLLQSVEDFRDRMRAAESRGREEHIDAISDAKKKIEYADQFVRRAELNVTLTSLLKEMWHWPTWIKRADFMDHCRVGLAELTADEIGSGRNGGSKRFAFRLGDQSYRFEFDAESSPSFDDFERGAIRLYCNGELVVSISVCRRVDDEDYDIWSYVQPTSLTIGPWIGPIIELEHEFRLAHQKWMQDLVARTLKEQSQRLPDAK